VTTTMTGHPHISSAALAVSGARRRRPHDAAAADTARTDTGTPATTSTGRPHPVSAATEARPHPHTGSATLGTSGAHPRRPRPHDAADTARTGSAAPAAAVVVTGRPWGAGVRSRPLAVLTPPSPRPAPEHWL
jgi:hypothetical protein